jgi:sterol desaturase/sphingolipid hydroxylase (fatty acid hydroxylase superfamily)
MEQLLLLITTPLYVCVILLEIILSHYHRPSTYGFRDTLYNLTFMLLNGGIDLAFRSVYVLVFAWLFQYRIIDWPTMGAAYWLGLIIGMDFLFYWLHRIDHQSRLFWAVHVTHHSSEKFNLSVGFRSSIFQPLYRFIYFLPLPWLGFAPSDILFIFSATQIWGILVHTEYINKLGWLEYVLVTPSHHRVHHASNVLYLDKNYGMLLIIWDRLFGSFQEELDPQTYEPIRYGLTSPLPEQGLAHAIFHEWLGIGKDLKRPVGLRNRLHYLLGPPGWSHDGSTQTTRELQEQYRQEK